MARGFTLIEIIIATIVVALGIFGLMVLFTTGGRAYQAGADASTAAIITRNILSQLEQEGVSEIGEDKIDVEYPGFDGRFRYDIIWQPLYRWGQTPAYVVKVKVKWMQAGQKKIYEMQTIILRKNPTS